MTFSLIDVLILGILFLGARKGYRRGMVGSILRLVRIIIAFIIAGKYTKPIVAFLDEKSGVVAKLAGFLQSLGISTMVDLVTDLLALIIIQGIVFLILWSLVGSIVNWISRKISIGVDRLYLGKINRIIGLVAGLIFRSFFILVLVGLLTVYATVIPDVGTGFSAKLAASVNNSFLVPYFQAVFMSFFSKLIN